MDSKFLIFLLVFFSRSLECDASSSTLSSSESLSGLSKRTLVSHGEVFEFGFFSLVPNSNRWYIAIWYKNIPERSYVWVANRNKPVDNSNSTFQIVDGDLLLRRQSDNYNFWSSREPWRASSSSLVVVELLDTGNLVLRELKNKDQQFYLWQSFDNPTDTLLPRMKLGFDPKRHTNKFLSSWRSPLDPAIGKYKFILQAQGSPEFSINETEVGWKLYCSGPWNGFKFAGLPDFVNLTWNREEGIVVFTPTQNNSYIRLQMTDNGSVKLFTWNLTTTKWDIPWISTKNKCDIYGFCHSNSFCDTTLPTVCNCIPGFEHKNTDGPPNCVRKTPLLCSEDHFSRLPNMNFPSKPDGMALSRKSKNAGGCALTIAIAQHFPNQIFYVLATRSVLFGEVIYTMFVISTTTLIMVPIFTSESKGKDQQAEE